MSSPDAATVAFDALEASLKTVFLHTGSALSNATTRDGNKLLSARLQLEKSLPNALRRWHEALNELEDQLTTTKAALHRDLAALKQSKAPQAIQSDSPTMSLDSDTVMVEAPTKETDDGIAERQNEATSKPTDAEAMDPIASTENAGSTGNPSAANKVPTPPQADADADAIAPTTNAEDPPSNIPPADTDTDVGSLLPGLLDYTNTTDPRDNTSTQALNLDDYISDPLFTSQASTDPAQLQPETGDNSTSIDDLFGEASALGDGIDTGAEEDNSNTFGEAFDASFSFGDLLMQDGDGGDGGMGGAAFDLSQFDANFFDLMGNGGGDVEGSGEGANGNGGAG